MKHNKRLTAFLWIAMLATTLQYAFARPGDDAVTMASFEQNYLDLEATLSMRNNTDSTLRQVAFRITYFDMGGNELNYEDYNKEIVIAPGKTKQVNLPAFRHDKFYSYYKSDANPGRPRRFKVVFQLLRVSSRPSRHSSYRWR